MLRKLMLSDRIGIDKDYGPTRPLWRVPLRRELVEEGPFRADEDCGPVGGDRIHSEVIDQEAKDLLDRHPTGWHVKSVEIQ